MKHQELSREIWQNYHNTNWNSNIFCITKSYVCSLFSKMTYEHLPQYELNQKSRIKIIPSQSYLTNFINKRTSDLSNVLKDMDFGENFILQNDDLIVIGTKLRNTIFIAIRGTQSFNDCFVDAKFLKISGLNDPKIKLHRGFYKAITKEYDNIIYHLSKFNNCNVFITGHSLGGAMAAILYNLLILNNRDFLEKNKLSLRSCYTFGMPRYANKYASQLLHTTFQLYNTRDVVPVLPPKIFGYYNCPKEYCLLNNNIKSDVNTGKLSFLRLIKLFNGKDFREHQIEFYVNKLNEIK